MPPEEKDLALEGALTTKVNRLPDDLAERVSALTRHDVGGWARDVGGWARRPDH